MAIKSTELPPMLLAAKQEIEETADWVQDPNARRIQQRVLEVVAKHLETCKGA